MRRVIAAWVFVFLIANPMLWADEPLPKIKAVATFSIVGDLVKNVGGDKVDLRVLVGADGDAHTFEPTPQDSIALAQAQVIFENGLHFEPWLDDLYTSSPSHAPRIVVTEGVEPIVLGNEPDPHAWHDVSNAMVMVERIRDGLMAADSSNSAYYKENAEKYLAEVAKTDHGIIDALKDIPDSHRQLVTSHDTLRYFAKRYGFTIIGTAIEGATTEATEPSASQMAQLVETIKNSGVKVVFAENTHNPKLLQSLSAEAGVTLAPRLYTDALGPIGSEGDSYINMMRYNVKILVDSLK